MKKELVFVGLGRMGAAMTEHLVEAGYTVHGYDASAPIRDAAAQFGVTVYPTATDAIAAMGGQKVIWLMVPSQFVDAVIAEIMPKLNAGDIVIDGGNSFFQDTLRRAKELAAKNIHYLDCGTSGGVDGARHGASLMVGGDQSAVQQVEHIFTTLATTDGYAHVGATGAGHFVKMVHNGIEYGMMGAIAEGLAFIESHAAELQIDSSKTLQPYEHGSIISSSLVGWLADAYRTPGYLENIAGEVPRGETEMEMEFIVEQDMTPVLQAALLQRKATRTQPSRVGVLISAMRNKFGGHKTIKNNDAVKDK